MSAFQGCSSLKSIIIPDSIIVIQSNVFSGCTSLSNVKLSENLQVIGEAAFGLCPLNKVTIPASVTAISALAFSGSGMASATFMGSKPIMRSKLETQADIFKNTAPDFKIYYYAEYADSWSSYTDYSITQIN